MIVFAGGAERLRRWATRVAGLGGCSYCGMDGENDCRSDGEVQVFRQYRREVAIAREAPEEVLRMSGGDLAPQELELLVWRRAETVRRRRLPLPARAELR